MEKHDSGIPVKADFRIIDAYAQVLPGRFEVILTFSNSDNFKRAHLVQFNKITDNPSDVARILRNFATQIESDAYMCGN